MTIRTRPRAARMPSSTTVDRKGGDGVCTVTLTEVAPHSPSAPTLARTRREPLALGTVNTVTSVPSAAVTP
jgi:hypothetical protein